MSAAMRGRDSRTRVISYHLGRTSLVALREAVRDLMSDPGTAIVIEVTGFDYFDENELHALADLVSEHDRVQLYGLELFANRLLDTGPLTIDVRTRAERAVTHYSSVTIVTAVVERDRLDERAWEQALLIAGDGGRAMVAIDVRALERLSPAELLAVAELSGDLQASGRSLVVVNAGAQVADQLRHAGLSGGLRLCTADLL